MFLEKLEIIGFKSFALKTVLEFPRPKSRDSFGITAIVGPNGSGKSNIVESIRWGLGEQSSKTLRIKKAEDIIFSGSDKRVKSNSAEIALYFNNEDGAAPIDYRQFIIKRKVYRDGTSEYSINNSRVRLQDILLLLAQSSFGQKSYSIISQGMIDSILHSSATERKIFFDEATGIRQYQIKKEDASKKLEKTQNNLQQAEIALQEIGPRMRSLTRQIKKLERRQKIEEELKNLQKKYYSYLRQNINNQLSIINKQIAETEKKKNIIEGESNQLQEKLKSMVYEKTSDDYQKLQDEQQKLINLKNEYLEKITILRGQLIIEQEKSRVSAKKLDLNPEKILNNLDEIQKCLSKIQSLSELETIKKEILKISDKIENLIKYLRGEKKEEMTKPDLSKIEQEINNLGEEIKKLNEKIQLASQELA
ncbi:MAG: AAA family ATPase, partial [Patescibacteria group bacterium]